ncbi:zinc finger, CCHC-type containing protein [Tanacetum coccineum]
MGEADVILGINIKRENKGNVITQSHYIEKILKKFNRKDCSSVSTPMDLVEKLKPNTGKPVDQLEYSRAIGCLMFAMTSTRPDIAYAVGTMNYGLSYVGYPSVLEAYSNTSWINHVEDSSSTSGWVFLLGGCAISWASKKQTCITGSTMEYEFVALAAVGKEAEWLRNLIHEILIWPKPIAPISIRCDSAATLAKAYSQMYNGKSRHLGVRHSMIRELIKNGVISIEFVRSQHNLADHLTKGLARDLPLPPVLVALEGQQVAPEIIAAHTAWIKGSKEIVGLMLMTMEPEIQRNLENLHANDMLKELKTLFAQQAEQELLQTTRDFHSCKQEEGQSVSSYVLKMKSYIDNLERLGHPVTLGLAVSLILIGLRKEFDGFVQNYNMHSLGKTVNELHAMLKLHEQTLTLPKNNAPALHAIRAGKVQKGKKHKKPQPQMAARGQNQGNGKNKHAYAPKPKIPPPPKREDPAKDSICHECGETGHWKRNCPQYLAELLKKKKNAASGAGGSGIFTIELNTFLNRSWIYDTGCGTHICNTTQGLRASKKLKSGVLSLYVGNGKREVVEFYIHCKKQKSQDRLRLCSLVALSSWTHQQETH